MKVLVVGLGGLGCPASLELARAGCALTLIDPDVVELSNLHRQPWHRDADVGRPKVESAAEKLRAAFPRLSVEALARRLDERNARELFERHDAVVDGTDGIAVKFLLSDTAVQTGRPLAWGGVLRLEGQAMRIRPGGPCLRCLFETPPADAPTCAQAGVLGSVAGVIGALQARLLLAPPEDPGVAHLHVFDGLSLSMRRLKVRRAKDCSACGGAESRVSMAR